MENPEEEISKETIRQEWIEYRNAVTENKSKSQDDFEKYINLLASGGLVLSLTFFEKIVPLEKAIYKPFVIAGMFLMVVTLLSNLYSHYKSIIDSDSTIKEIDDEINRKRYLQTLIDSGNLSEIEIAEYYQLVNELNEIGFYDVSLDSRFNKFIELTSRHEVFQKSILNENELEEIERISKEVAEEIMKERKSID